MRRLRIYIVEIWGISNLVAELLPANANSSGLFYLTKEKCPLIYVKST